ncbi:zinc-dependent metalloprotease [Leucobacter chinensis]|uniref:zinc-dependent metalloprotease n=1 Tax=Leucobacter chinensis TaxID=2851010 RepID=UPI001C21D1BF|nr:zinc-dependent metalloprotease [Leucobacter chinensis]
MTSDHFSDDGRDNEFDPARDIEEILRGMLSGQNFDGFGIDPSELAKAAGLPIDQAALQQMLGALQHAMTPQAMSGETDWSLARKTAIDVASKDGNPSTRSLQSAFSTASLWLDSATTMGASADAPRELQRIEWVQQTLDTWIEMAEPVADSISQALTSAMQEQLPEEFQSAVSQASGMLKGVGAALFAMQLGQVVGSLAREVVSGGDVGVPLLGGPGKEGGALLPENVAAFAKGLDQETTEVELFLATRELAHSRLFRHARWLRSHLMSAVGEYARGIEINVEHIEDLAIDLDPQNPEQIQEILRSGQLIPPKTERQQAAHERLETMIALVDGYVDVVTLEATKLLPGATALAEMIRRRRAAGGPAERAFATLVGLELRPRKLREAAALWQLVGEKGGIETRDGLWAHPDFLPTIEELENPELLLKRIGLVPHEADPAEIDFDRELKRLLEEGDLGDQGTGETSES